MPDVGHLRASSVTLCSHQHHLRRWRWLRARFYVYLWLERIVFVALIIVAAIYLLFTLADFIALSWLSLNAACVLWENCA